MDALITLAAVVVGAVASVGGTIYVGRAELTRRERIRLYQDVVSPLIKEVRGIADSYNTGNLRDHGRVQEQLTALSRATVIAGRADSRQVEGLEELLAKATTFVGRTGAELRPQIVEHASVLREVEQRLTAYDLFLQQKIR